MVSKFEKVIIINNFHPINEPLRHSIYAVVNTNYAAEMFVKYTSERKNNK